MLIPVTVPFSAWTAITLLPLILFTHQKNLALRAFLKTSCAFFFLFAALQCAASALLSSTGDHTLIPPFYAMVPPTAIAAGAGPVGLSHVDTSIAGVLLRPSTLFSFKWVDPSVFAEAQDLATSAAPPLTSGSEAASFEKSEVAKNKEDSNATEDSSATAGHPLPSVTSAPTDRANAKRPLSEASTLLSTSPAVLFPPSSLPQLLLSLLSHGPAWQTITLIGLLCSFVGDVALLGRTKTAFLAGLAAFLLAHVAFAVAHAARLASLPLSFLMPSTATTATTASEAMQTGKVRVVSALVPALAPLAAILCCFLIITLAWLWQKGTLRHQSPFMVRAVIVYVAAIAAMTFLAWCLVLITPAAESLGPAVGVVVASTRSRLPPLPEMPELARFPPLLGKKGWGRTTNEPTQELVLEPSDATILRSDSSGSSSKAKGSQIETSSAPRLTKGASIAATAATAAVASTAATAAAAAAAVATSTAAGATEAAAVAATAAAAASAASLESVWVTLPALARQTALTAVAAVLFMASDVFVARERFVKAGSENQAMGLPLYFCSQLVLAAALKEV